MSGRVQEKKIGVIGCGNMGRAIIDAILKTKLLKPKNICVFDKDIKKSRTLERCGLAIAASINNVVQSADIVIFAVKPQNIDDCIYEIESGGIGSTLIVSILAGTTIKRLTQLCGKEAKIIRCMPNLGIIVGEGMTAYCVRKNVTKMEMRCVEEIFSCCGNVLKVSESKMDTITAISGSGPAYYFYFTELLINAGMQLGLEKKEASLLAIKTARGAAQLMDCENDAPGMLRKKVTSPGGTTEAALKKLMSKQLQNIFSSAILKAKKRAESLSV